LLRKSLLSTSSGFPLGRHFRPEFLKFPTNSFFLVRSLPITDKKFYDRADRLRLDIEAEVIPRLKACLDQLANASKQDCYQLLFATNTS